MPVKTLAISGSRRPGSLNSRLLRVAVDDLRSRGTEVTILDHDAHPLPIYDGELESREGVPENAMRLKSLFKVHDSLLIASPEYNSSVTPLLKNLIDWVSRPVPQERPLECFRGKVAGLISASPGFRGGMRALVHVRDILGNIGVYVIPTEFSLAFADKAFDADGRLADEKHLKAVHAVTAELAHAAEKLRHPPT